MKPVITWEGVEATKEHVVYLSDDEKTTLGKAMENKKEIWSGN